MKPYTFTYESSVLLEGEAWIRRGQEVGLKRSDFASGKLYRDAVRNAETTRRAAATGQTAGAATKKAAETVKQKSGSFTKKAFNHLGRNKGKYAIGAAAIGGIGYGIKKWHDKKVKDKTN